MRLSRNPALIGMTVMIGSVRPAVARGNPSGADAENAMLARRIRRGARRWCRARRHRGREDEGL